VSVRNAGHNKPVVPATEWPNGPVSGWILGLVAAAAVALVAAGMVATAGGGTGAGSLALVAVACLLAALVLGLTARFRAHAIADASLGQLAAMETLFDGASSGYYFWNLRDGSEQRSPRLASLVGAGERAVRFAAIAAKFDANDSKRLNAALTALRDGGPDFAMIVADTTGKRRFKAEGRPFADRDGIRSGVVLWLHEASAFAAEAEKARAERDQLSAILDALPVPVWRRDDDLSLAYCNKAYADIVEADRESALADGGIELVAEAGQARARALAIAARNGNEAQAESLHAVVDGRRRFLKISESPLAGGAGSAGIAWDITDLEDANRSLTHHVEGHAEVLEKLVTAIAIFGPDKQLKFFNSAYANLWGLDEDWLRTEPPIAEILETLRAKGRIPEVPDFPSFKKKREALFIDLIESSEEVLHLPNGAAILMVVKPHPFGGLLFTFEDVTDKLALERSLNTLIAVQRETLDNLYEGVAVFGSDGRLKLSNPGFARLWHLDPKDLEGEPHIADVVERTRDLYDFGEDWDAYKAGIIARTSERSPILDRLERRDGSVLECASVPLPDGATLMTYLDVTDSIKVERALRERNEALEDADRLKSEFIANVSYELRTPLNTIIGFSELLDTAFFGDLNARQSEYVKGILESSQHLLQLINDILDLASIEAGRLQLDVARFDADAMLASMMTLTEPRARMENMSLKLDCPETLGHMVGDERRIKQVLLHLLINAIEYSPDGSEVTLEARRDDDTVRISVVDAGIGMGQDEQERMFDKFWRSDRARTHHRSDGLGLSLVKSFVELHSGTVEVASRPGVGTRVTCRLPIETQQAHETIPGDTDDDRKAVAN
jgi:signal transduction histidine kinase